MIETQTGSFLPRQRDLLIRRFLDSPCLHLLCVDSDIGWHAEQAQRLIDTGKDFVSGVYCKKTPKRELPFEFIDSEGELRRCAWAPGGFLLVSRQAIELMAVAYAGLQYESGTPVGRATALWFPMFDPQTPYSSEDVAFCRRWTALGGEIWAHMGVKLRHHGEAVFEA